MVTAVSFIIVKTWKDLCVQQHINLDHRSSCFQRSKPVNLGVWQLQMIQPSCYDKIPLNINNLDTENQRHVSVDIHLSDKKYKIELTIKRCSNLYEIRKMQIKMSYHLKAISMAKIRKLDNSRVGKMQAATRIVNWYSHSSKLYTACCCCLVIKSCLTLCYPADWSPPGPLSMGFSRREYWSGLPFPSPGDLPDSGFKPTSPALAGGFITTEPPVRLSKLTHKYISSPRRYQKVSDLLKGAQNRVICGSGEQEGKQNISKYCLESQGITHQKHTPKHVQRETEWYVQSGTIMYTKNSCTQNYTHFLKIYFYLFIWLYLVLVVTCGIQFPDLGPQHWERGVLATGPPGKSLWLNSFINLFLAYRIWGVDQSYFIFFQFSVYRI